MPTLSAVPDIAIGERRLERLGEDILAEAGRPARVVVVIDAALARLGLTERVRQAAAAGVRHLTVFDSVAGEPGAAVVDAAADAMRDAGATIVVAVGGGSALDVGKLAAAIAPARPGAVHYQLAASPLPPRPLPVIAIPTTAGTGSEATTTAVFTGAEGRKVWAWGPQLLPRRVILDAGLTASLPPPIVAATGLDALVHAIEAATNRHANAYNTETCLSAIRLIARELPVAVEAPATAELSRERLLVASCWAGIAINNCGTAIAHTIAHALGSLGRIHHGRAAALGLRASLPWNITHNGEAFAVVAEAMGGAREAAALPGLFDALVRRVGLKVGIADELDGVTPERLAAEMALPENVAMRRSNAKPSSDADLVELAHRVLEAE